MALNKSVYYYYYYCCRSNKTNNTRTHTHTRLTALFPGLPGWASTRKIKPIWILLKQETVSGSGISWATCKSASCSRQITMPVPHHSKVFLQAGCPSCRPTNSVKALKAKKQDKQVKQKLVIWQIVYNSMPNTTAKNTAAADMTSVLHISQTKFPQITHLVVYL